MLTTCLEKQSNVVHRRVNTSYTRVIPPQQSTPPPTFTSPLLSSRYSHLLDASPSSYEIFVSDSGSPLKRRKIVVPPPPALLPNQNSRIPNRPLSPQKIFVDDSGSPLKVGKTSDPPTTAFPFLLDRRTRLPDQACASPWEIFVNDSGSPLKRRRVDGLAITTSPLLPTQYTRILDETFSPPYEIIVNDVGSPLKIKRRRVDEPATTTPPLLPSPRTRLPDEIFSSPYEIFVNDAGSPLKRRKVIPTASRSVCLVVTILSSYINSTSYSHQTLYVRAYRLLLALPPPCAHSLFPSPGPLLPSASSLTIVGLPRLSRRRLRPCHDRCV